MTKRLILDTRHLYETLGLLGEWFAPIRRFMNLQEAKSVCYTMRTPEQVFYPLPHILRVNCEQLQSIQGASKIWLCRTDQTPVAELEIEEVAPWDTRLEAYTTLHTTDENHPFYQYLLENKYNHIISGTLKPLRHASVPIGHGWDREAWWSQNRPSEIRALKKTQGLTSLIGFQTRNPLHRSHITLIQQAYYDIQAKTGEPTGVLLHPVVGPTQDVDVDVYKRIRMYQLLQAHFETPVITRWLPIGMRMAGPREALWHGVIRRNVGCTHFIVGRDHAGPTPKRADGKSFYQPFDAQEIALKHEQDIGLKILAMPEFVYDLDKKKYVPESVAGINVGKISGTAMRNAVREGLPLPSWFTIPEVEKELRKPEPPKGNCIYVFGRSGSGKTTFILDLLHQLQMKGIHPSKISVLDGDEIRRLWSPDLGFTPKERQQHIRRIGKLAGLISKHSGISLVANIAPFEEDREWNRNYITKSGGNYIDIWMDIPESTCMERDAKGLYGEKGVKAFGVFEEPMIHPPKYRIRTETDYKSAIDSIIKTLTAES